MPKRSPSLCSLSFSLPWFGNQNDLVSKEYLNWDHVKELHHRGHVIGSHSHHHYGDADDFEVSLQLIANVTGERPKCISYPNGVKNISDDELRALKIDIAYLSSQEGGHFYRSPRIDCNQFSESLSGVV